MLEGQRDVDGGEPFRFSRSRGSMHSSPGGYSMMEEIGPVENVRRAVREPGQPHRVERLLVVRPQEGADAEAAGSELEDLPGVVGVTLNTATGSFDILFDPVVVSDDELAAALHYQGYDLTSWQEVRAMHAAQQRSWLLEQIRSLASHAELELAERGAHADGVTKGSIDAYIRTARAFGLVTDAEIVELIPARSLGGRA
jgi:copper chaperone CopZ